MKTIFCFIFLFFSITIYSQDQELVLNYEIDQSKLTFQHQGKLNSFIENIPIEQVQSILIIGHTDTTASVNYNRKLSKRRAEEVKNFFLSKSISPNLLTVDWKGETQAVSPLDLMDDRRVMVQVFFPIEKKIVIESKNNNDTLTESIFLPPVSELFDLMAPPIQEFCLSFKKDTVIRCTNGTIIQIPKDAYVLNSIQRRSKSCVRFQVREVFSFSEMVTENLSTTSNGEVLETQGMIYTNALLDGDTLDLKNDLTILMPTDTIKEGVQVFDGGRDPHNDVMNWSVSNNSVLRNFNVIELANCLKYNALWKECRSDNNFIVVHQDQKAECINRVVKMCKDFFGNCEKCEILPCRVNRIGKPLKGLFNKRVREENRDFRKCQKLLRKRKNYFKKRNKKNLKKLMSLAISFGKGKDKSKLSKKELEKIEILEELTELIENSDQLIQEGLISRNYLNECDKLNQLFKDYKVDNVDDLVLEINRPLLNEFGVKTMDALLDTLPKVNLENIEVAYRNETISFEDYKFYIFNTSNFGWKNLDIFTKLKPDQLTKIKVNVFPERNVDCKLIIQERSFVLPGKLAKDHFYFNGIPKEESAWIVAIKYENNQPFLALEKIKIKKGEYNVKFESLTLEALKEKLKVLDF